MLMSIISALIVSVDAFFIGLSLGLQKKCRFLYLVTINIFLFGVCLLGFFIAEAVYEAIPFDYDLLIGFSFIALGSWYILNYFISGWFKRFQEDTSKDNTKLGTVILVGLVMSIEAMLITMGITFIFIPNSTIAIPVTVGFTHLGYSAFSFYLARSNYLKRIPVVFAVVISGVALIIYGLLALFVDLAV